MAALKSIGSMLAIQVFGAGTAFLTVLVLAGVMGPESYGRYAWVISMAGIISVLLQRGLPATIVKHFAPLDLDGVVRLSPIANTFALYVLGSTGLILATLPIMPLLLQLPLERPEIFLALPVALALASLSICEAILRAAEQGERALFVSQVMRTLVMLAVSVLLAFIGIDQPEAYLELYAISALLPTLVFTWSLLSIAVRKWRDGGYIRSNSDHFQASFTRSVGNHLPVFITGFFVPPDVLAYLAIAVRLTGPVQFGLTASGAYFAARINRFIKALNFEAVRGEYSSAKRYSSVAGGLAAIGVLGFIWMMIQWPAGPFSKFTNPTLLLSIFFLLTIFRLGLVVFGPVQLTAILLGSDQYVRKLNLVMLGFLVVGLLGAGLIGEILVSATFMIVYGVMLSGGLALRVSRAMRESGE